MKRTDDFHAMVASANVDESKKTVAMSYVNSLRPLENGSANQVSAIAAALLANAPMNLEIYLRESPSKDAVRAMVDESIAAHSGACLGAITTAANLPAGKLNMITTLVKTLGWPGVAIIALFKFAPQINQFFAAITN